MKNFVIKFSALFFILIGNCFSQTMCFKIDSLKIYYLPWTMRAKIALTEDDVRTYQKSKFFNIKVIKDSSTINKFCNINFVNNDKISTNKSLDVRMVIDAYAGKNTITINLDSFIFYRYLNQTYAKNWDLINWLNTYITPTP